MTQGSFQHFSFVFAATDIINGDAQPVWDTQYGLPFFDNTTTKRDVVATVGQSAKLHCKVRNLGDRAVSEGSNSKNVFVATRGLTELLSVLPLRRLFSLQGGLGNAH